MMTLSSKALSINGTGRLEIELPKWTDEIAVIRLDSSDSGVGNFIGVSNSTFSVEAWPMGSHDTLESLCQR